MPKMIGAHKAANVTPLTRRRPRRAQITEAAREFNRAYDVRFCADRPQLDWRNTIFTPRR